MKNLPSLFKIVELTRSQVQYGYVLAGVKKRDLSNLAEHHYLVAFMAWQMASHLNILGSKLNVQKVLELCMIHDLGEIFGGDISRYYGTANPKARKLAKAYESENQRFLKKYLTSVSKKMWEEVMEPKSDEGIIYKLADFMECGHFLEYMGYFRPLDMKILQTRLPQMANKLKDPIAKREMKKFIQVWLKSIHGKDATDLMFG